MVASRGSEKITVGRLSAVKPVSTVPGDGGVTEQAPVREASERSAAHYTKPASAKVGG